MGCIIIQLYNFSLYVKFFFKLRNFRCVFSGYKIYFCTIHSEQQHFLLISFQGKGANVRLICKAR